MRISSGGVVTAVVDFRAPIFYDSDNTGYYVDPAGNSKLGFATFDGYDGATGDNTRSTVGVSVGRYTSEYSYIELASSNANNLSWIDFSKANGTDYHHRIRGYNAYLTFFSGGNEEFRIYPTYTLALGSSRAPLFYDSDNTGYYVDPAGTSIQNFIKIYSPTPNLAIEDSNNAGGGGAMGIITFRNTGGKAIGIGYTSNETTNSDLIISTNAASTYGGYLGLDAGAISDSQADIILDPKTKVRVHSNLSFGIPGNGQNTNGRFLSIEGNTDASGEGSGRIFFTEHNSTTSSMSDYGMSLGYRGGSTSVVGADGNTWTGLTAVGNGWWGMWGHDGSPTGSLIMSGPRTGAYVNFSQSSGVRAQIYYDLNDTNYYIDPNSTTTAGFIRGKLLIGTNNTWGKTIQIGGNGREYVNNTNVASVVTTNGNLHLDAASGSETYLNYYDGNKVHFGNGTNGTVGEIHSDGSARFPVFYDFDNTAYYANPGSTSKLYKITTNGSNIRVKLGVWSTTSTYGIGMMNGFTFGPLNNNYAMTFEMNDESSRGFWWGDAAHTNAQGAMALTTDGRLTVARSLRVGYGESDTTSLAAGMQVSGDINVTGDVVASCSSDERLKDNKKNIENALEKVESLNGVEFDWNDKQDVYEGHDIGVIAQEVEKIAPEIVNTRDNGYKAVKYEKLVPLLIEAIKELSNEIKELKNK
jgi:hypothetical protein